MSPQNSPDCGQSYLAISGYSLPSSDLVFSVVLPAPTGLWYSGSGLPTLAFICHKIAGVTFSSVISHRRVCYFENFEKIASTACLWAFPSSQQLPQPSLPSLAPPPASRFSPGVWRACKHPQCSCYLPASVYIHRTAVPAQYGCPLQFQPTPPPPHYFRQPIASAS